MILGNDMNFWWIDKLIHENNSMSIAHGQPSDPNVSSSTHTIPTLVTQRHCSTPVNAAPTLPKATLVRRDIYIGNAGLLSLK
jgi:hypothetical protein